MGYDICRKCGCGYDTMGKCAGCGHSYDGPISASVEAQPIYVVGHNDLRSNMELLGRKIDGLTAEVRELKETVKALGKAAGVEYPLPGGDNAACDQT